MDERFASSDDERFYRSHTARLVAARPDGYSLAAIAEELGVGESEAEQLVRSALAKLQAAEGVPRGYDGGARVVAPRVQPDAGDYDTDKLYGAQVMAAEAMQPSDHTRAVERAVSEFESKAERYVLTVARASEIQTADCRAGAVVGAGFIVEDPPAPYASWDEAHRYVDWRRRR